MKTIVTGFEKFLKYGKNSTEQYIKHFKMKGVQTYILPVSFHRIKAAAKTIIRSKPRLVIALGQKETRYIELEKIGLNYMHSDAPDNDNKKYFMKRIHNNGQTILETKLKIGKIYKTLKGRTPIKLSFHAGTYVCNCLYYCLLYEARRQSPKTKIIFVHIPTKLSTKLKKGLDKVINSVIKV